MAIDSKTTRPPSIKAGTLPFGDCAWMRSELSDWRNQTISSSKGMPAVFAASQGRIDQDE